MDPITTDNLVLRAPEEQDYGFLIGLHRDPKVREFLGGTFRYSLERLQPLLAISEPEAAWIVTHEGYQIGLITVERHKDGTDYELSYQFVPQYWGQGLAREACRAALDWARTTAGHNRMIAETQAANARSCAMLEALGFVAERELERFGAPQVIYAV